MTAIDSFAGMNSPLAASQALRRPASAAAHFSDVLKVADAGQGRKAKTMEQTVRQSAQELVAGTLVAPILAQTRDDPFRSKMFHGGMAEDMFTQQLDSILSDRIVKTANLPVVDAVYQRIMKRTSKSQAPNLKQITSEQTKKQAEIASRGELLAI